MTSPENLSQLDSIKDKVPWRTVLRLRSSNAIVIMENFLLRRSPWKIDSLRRAFYDKGLKWQSHCRMEVAVFWGIESGLLSSFTVKCCNSSFEIAEKTKGFCENVYEFCLKKWKKNKNPFNASLSSIFVIYRLILVDKKYNWLNYRILRVYWLQTCILNQWYPKFQRREWTISLKNCVGCLFRCLLLSKVFNVNLIIWRKNVL